MGAAGPGMGGPGALFPNPGPDSLDAALIATRAATAAGQAHLRAAALAWEREGVAAAATMAHVPGVGAGVSLFPAVLPVPPDAVLWHDPADPLVAQLSDFAPGSSSSSTALAATPPPSSSPLAPPSEPSGGWGGRGGCRRCRGGRRGSHSAPLWTPPTGVSLGPVGWDPAAWASFHHPWSTMWGAEASSAGTDLGTGPRPSAAMLACVPPPSPWAPPPDVSPGPVGWDPAALANSFSTMAPTPPVGPA